MFVRNKTIAEQMIKIPVDEYAELIECKTRLNVVHELITKNHAFSLKRTGRKESKIDTDLLEIASGYEENENYFKCLKEEYERRRLGK